MRPALPLAPGGPSAVAPQARDWDVLLTAETHNFPCAVAPYPGDPVQPAAAPMLVAQCSCLVVQHALYFGAAAY